MGGQWLSEMLGEELVDVRLFRWCACLKKWATQRWWGMGNGGCLLHVLFFLKSDYWLPECLVMLQREDWRASSAAGGGPWCLSLLEQQELQVPPTAHCRLLLAPPLHGKRAFLSDCALVAPVWMEMHERVTKGREEMLEDGNTSLHEDEQHREEGNWDV